MKVLPVVLVLGALLLPGCIGDLFGKDCEEDQVVLVDGEWIPDCEYRNAGNGDQIITVLDKDDTMVLSKDRYEVFRAAGESDLWINYDVAMQEGPKVAVLVFTRDDYQAYVRGEGPEPHPHCSFQGAYADPYDDCRFPHDEAWIVFDNTGYGEDVGSGEEAVRFQYLLKVQYAR